MADIETTESIWELPESLRLELLARLSADPSRPAGMTYEEFMAWADEDTLAEWVDGRVVMTSPASDRHQMLVSFFDTVLGQFVAVHDLGTVRIAPFQMELESAGREPDVLFVARAHLDRLRPNRLAGPADLVIEIVSPESVRRDRGDKFYEYEAARIPEYWLIDPVSRQAVFYRLDQNGFYEPVITGSAGIFRSEVLSGFWLDLDWLWQDPMPDPITTLLTIDRDGYGAHLRERLRRAQER